MTAIPTAFALLLILAFMARKERAPEPSVVRRLDRAIPSESLEPPLPTAESLTQGVDTRQELPRSSAQTTPPVPVPPPSRKTDPLPWRPGYMGMTGVDAAGGGAQVTQVFAQTAAAHAGLQTGDIVVEFDGRAVTGLDSLFQAARNAGEGTPIILHVRRNGVDLFLGLQLGRHPQFN